MFNSIAVLGLGLIGGSIASAVLQKGVAQRVIGYDPFAGERALALHLVSELAHSPQEAVQEADLVVFAVPPSKTIALIETCWPHVKSQALLTDAASTKGAISDYALAHQLKHFVPAHPIAGSERSGPEAAQPKLLNGAKVVLCPLSINSAEVVDKVGQFWSALGARLQLMHAEEHDRTYALVSHLPHWVAFALAHCLSSQGDADQLRQLSGAGLKDTTRIAASSAALWADISQQNKKELLDAIADFQGSMTALQQALETDNIPALESLMQQAKAWRESF
jgi:prephenate dehydrogenase